MGDCKHQCNKASAFPADIYNRPALATIDYRIGLYSSIREHLLDRLNSSSTLEAWTHRGADDPGIALLEGTAIVGDMLTYYQSLYGNEAFLRTATWRESISDLVRMLGYRLSPGVGGEAEFSIKVKGDKPVTVPAAFGFKARLKGEDQDAEFESAKEMIAWPHLSEFHLYRSPQGRHSIQAGGNQLELKAVAGAEDLSSLQSVDIGKGDRIMLVPDASMFDENISYTEQKKAEILIVSAVETILDRAVITFDGNLSETRESSVTAYKIDRTFRHFGYNAPNKTNKFDGATVEQEDTVFDRNIYSNAASLTSDTDYYSEFTSYEMPLDQEVDDLALGGKLICQGRADFTGQNDAGFTVVKEIKEIQPDALVWGHSSGPASVLTLEDLLMPNVTDARVDIRRSRFHEVISQELTLTAPAVWSDGMFSDGRLQYFGTFEEVKALAGRSLLLVNENSGQMQRVISNNSVTDFETALADRDSTNQWMWDISLDQIPEFKREDFDQLEPAVIVYGNQVPASQGKTEKEAVLGSGDNRLAFQTFTIPKAPLTYLLDENQTPAEAPELHVYVEGIRWDLVDTFFDCEPDAKVYIVRQDQDGNSLIQFGDGKTGARLPSGRKNVTALYRTGIGAAGALEEGVKAKGTGKLKELEDVFMPIAAVGGGKAESGDGARDAAPGKVQSLDRLVSLADFESEALAIPGVIKVRADWAAPSGTPMLSIVVLSETAGDAAVAKVQAAMNGFNRSRGPARFPIQVEQGGRQYLYLNVRVGFMASFRPENIELAIKEALGLGGEEGNGVDGEHGLFSLQNRSFGQGAHRSRIEAAMQQVEGVIWVEIGDAQPLDAGSPPESDPAKIAKPFAPSTGKVVLCPPASVLALHSTHLDLQLVADESGRECGL